MRFGLDTSTGAVERGRGAKSEVDVAFGPARVRASAPAAGGLADHGHLRGSDLAGLCLPPRHVVSITDAPLRGAAGSLDLLGTIRPGTLMSSSDVVPERFELGTRPDKVLAGATTAVAFLAAIAPGGATSRREALADSW